MTPPPATAGHASANATTPRMHRRISTSATPGSPGSTDGPLPRAVAVPYSPASRKFRSGSSARRQGRCAYRRRRSLARSVDAHHLRIQRIRHWMRPASTSRRPRGPRRSSPSRRRLPADGRRRFTGRARPGARSCISWSGSRPRGGSRPMTRRPCIARTLDDHPRRLADPAARRCALRLSRRSTRTMHYRRP